METDKYARQKRWYQRNREKRLAYQKEYDKINEDAMKPYKAAYRLGISPEKKKQYNASHKEYRKLNREKINAKKREYYKLNREKIMEYQKGWYRRLRQSIKLKPTHESNYSFIAKST